MNTIDQFNASIATMDFNFFEVGQMSQIERDRAYNLAVDDVLANILPFDTQDGDAVTWSKEDDVFGLLPAKAPGVAYPNLDVQGAKRYSIPASHFGGEETVPAKEIISRARLTGFEKMDINEMLSQRQENLAIRELHTLNLHRGQLLTTGSVNVYDKDENVVDTWIYDGFADRTITLTGGDVWSDGSATADGIGLISKLDADATFGFYGSGYSCGADGLILMNPRTFARLRTQQSWKQFRGPGNMQMISVQDYNNRFAGENGGLPTLRIITGTALMKNGTIAPYIPDGYMVAIGSHVLRGTQCGNWVITTNENTGDTSIFAAADRRPNYPRLPFAIRSVAGAPKLKSLKQVRSFKLY